jgi:perosamine synthetase
MSMDETPHIPVSRPDLTALERSYLLDAFDSSWIASTGPYVQRFEGRFAEFCQVPHAVSCTNGTCALHLALLALEIGSGDEVIVPDQTYVSTANAVRYVGATPVFADCDPLTWTIDPASVERLLSPRTRAIVAVHLFGVPADMDRLRPIADDAGCALVEDAAQAHGARWAGRRVGSPGDISTFSFYGNKILTTGEGGMVCTGDDRLAARVRKLKGQGADPARHYWFDEVGYNYRMTNLACAVGLAQLERFEELRDRRERVRRWYLEALSEEDLPLIVQQTQPQAEAVLWMQGVVLEDAAPAEREELRRGLAAAGIETRPFFPSLSSLPIYDDCPTDAGCPVSRHLGERGIMLPTHTQLERDDVRRIVAAVSSLIGQPAGAA